MIRKTRQNEPRRGASSRKSTGGRQRLLLFSCRLPFAFQNKNKDKWADDDKEWKRLVEVLPRSTFSLFSSPPLPQHSWPFFVKLCYIVSENAMEWKWQSPKYGSQWLTKHANDTESLEGNRKNNREGLNRLFVFCFVFAGYEGVFWKKR